MMQHHLCAGLAALLALGSFGCRKGPETPERVANEFLAAVKREDCAEAWKYFSAASQEKIRAASAEAIKSAPYYAEEFKPENLYCKSTFANRFPRPVPGSARLQKIEATNAIVIAQRREPAGFALPGFSPMGSKTVPLEIFLVQENGEWKIDVVRPTTAERDVMAARQRAIQGELDAMNAYRARTNMLELQPPPPPPPPAPTPRASSD